MNASSIQSLRPNVTRQEALRTFSRGNVSTLYWKVRSGPLQRIADAYVPYRLYRVRYNMGRTAHTTLFASDAVNGSLDLFTFPHVPAEGELISTCTRNLLAPSLDHTLAEATLRQKILRVIFRQGFFKVRDLKLEIALEPLELHIPYWLGFYGNTFVRCRVMDAVRRRIEGAKASAFFETWLATS